MTYGIEKPSPVLGQTQKGGGVKPFNGIQTNDTKPAQTQTDQIQKKLIATYMCSSSMQGPGCYNELGSLI